MRCHQLLHGAGSRKFVNGAFTHRETGHTGAVTAPFALVASITSLGRTGVEEEKRQGQGRERGTLANRFLLGFFMNETWIVPGCWPRPPLPPGGWPDMEAEVLRDVPGYMEGAGEGVCWFR